MIQGIIFDLDGVLVDAVEWHYLALNRALSLVGYAIERREHDAVFNGLPTAVKLDLLSERRGLPRKLHAFLNEMKQRATYELVAREFRPDGAVRELLAQLKARGLKIGIASNSRRATVELFLERLGALPYCDAVFSPEAVSRPKPDPEIYTRCSAALGLPADACLVLEDSPVGIQAARQAGARVAVVRSPSQVTVAFVDAQLARWAPAPTPPADRTQILVPMAGEGSRFVAAGFREPKPFLDLFGRPMIQWVVENVRPSSPHRFVFLCREQHLSEYGAGSFLERLAPGSAVVSVPATTEGAACTALLAADELCPDAPLLIVNSDQWVDTDIDRFLAAARFHRCDGMIMTFPATDRKWSFARTDGAGRVVEVAEKNPISERATVGIYYFRRAGDFLEGAMAQIRRDARVNGEFYVCPVFNELVARPGAEVRVYDITADAMHGLGTPEDRETFIRWNLAQATRRLADPSAHSRS